MGRAFLGRSRIAPDIILMMRHPAANIAAIGILRKEGYEVSTGDFMRIGIPFTLVAVSTGYLFCWLVWH